MTEIKASISGIETVTSALNNLGASIASTEKPLQLAADVIGASTKQRFESGTTTGGSPMQAIKPASRRQRKEDKSAPPLTDTGALRRAATATTLGVPNSLFSIDPAAGVLTMGVERADARRHQLGFGPEPARPYEDITESDEVAIVTGLDAYYSGVTAGLGL